MGLCMLHFMIYRHEKSLTHINHFCGHISNVDDFSFSHPPLSLGKQRLKNKLLSKTQRSLKHKFTKKIRPRFVVGSQIYISRT